MMKKERYFCDRCGKEVKYPINTPYNIYWKKTDDYIDLCQECYDDFRSWMSKKVVTDNGSDD